MKRNMTKGIVEAMYLDINRNTRMPWGERIEGGMVVSHTPIPADEHTKVREIYDWSIEKQMRKLNWEELKETRIFIKPRREETSEGE